jgi:NADPH2:quinone reductase
MREAAALPLVSITAWEGLVDRMHIATGDTVLVQGGSGGVGHVAVQIVQALGAAVFATGSGHNKEKIEKLGASFIDRTESVADYVARLTQGRGFDRVYDTAGGAALDASFEAVRRFGHVVSSLGWGTHRLAPLSFKSATYSGVFVLTPLLSGEERRHQGDILEQIAGLVDTDRLRPVLDDRRFAFDTVREAHRLIRDQTAKGKVVVDIARF